MKQFKDMSKNEITALLNETALSVLGRIPPGTLFALLLFDDSHHARYVSNANRDDIIASMREFAEALENMEDTPT
jgi:hypothetical protein